MNKYDLSDKDYKELAHSLTFKEFLPNEEVYKFHDKPDEFFIIINGKLSKYVRNSDIANWDWAMSIYKSLLEWKSKEFDKKVKA